MQEDCLKEGENLGDDFRHLFTPKLDNPLLPGILPAQFHQMALVLLHLEEKL
jgi:hypothetical protein